MATESEIELAKEVLAEGAYPTPAPEVAEAAFPKQTEAFVYLKNALDEADKADKRIKSIVFYADSYSITFQ